MDLISVAVSVLLLCCYQINELRDHVEELTSTRERQSRKIRKLTEKVGRLHDKLLPPWPPKPSSTTSAMRDQNHAKSGPFSMSPTPKHGSSASKTTADADTATGSSMPTESDTSDFHSSTGSSCVEDENSPPSQTDDNSVRNLSEGASRMSSSYQQAQPPPQQNSYMKKQLQTVIRRKDVAIKNLREQLQARDTKLRELQVSLTMSATCAAFHTLYNPGVSLTKEWLMWQNSAETMRARHRRRVLRLEVDARAELQRRHAVVRYLESLCLNYDCVCWGSWRYTLSFFSLSWH